ncbi:MAG: hypothetical protein NVS1B13_14900 [Flavisolibacter sp.]
MEVEQLIKEGALILDVRSQNEFEAGHINGSKNIPLPILENRKDEIRKMNCSVITVCASGRRSAIASSLLRENGIKALNGGPWVNVKKIINRHNFIKISTSK